MLKAFPILSLSNLMLFGFEFYVVFFSGISKYNGASYNDSFSNSKLLIYEFYIFLFSSLVYIAVKYFYKSFIKFQAAVSSVWRISATWINNSFSRFIMGRSVIQSSLVLAFYIRFRNAWLCNIFKSFLSRSISLKLIYLRNYLFFLALVCMWGGGGRVV